MFLAVKHKYRVEVFSTTPGSFGRLKRTRIGQSNRSSEHSVVYNML